MKLMPIRYSADVAASVLFYTALGLQVGPVSRPGAWAELAAGPSLLAIHQASGDAVGSCELAFEADESLENVRQRLTDAGFTPEPIIDENYGRSMRVIDPDGSWVQINEHDRELYT